MDHPSQLSEAERERIALHAKRLSAWMSLRALASRWRAELELQEKANLLVARALGVLALLAAVATAVYAMRETAHLFTGEPTSTMLLARKLCWYLALASLSASVFFVGLSFAIWRNFERLWAVSGKFFAAALVLTLGGLLIAPFLVWLAAS